MKGGVTLYSPLKVLLYRSNRSRWHVKVNGKIKMMRKQKRSKEKDLGKLFTIVATAAFEIPIDFEAPGYRESRTAQTIPNVYGIV